MYPSARVRLFSHREIRSKETHENWRILARTISREKAFEASEALGEASAVDMLDFSGTSPGEVKRIYFKLRDGMAMASGMRRALPNVDVRYIISQEKQRTEYNREPISFFEGYDGYSDEMIWFADPINASGHTAVESLRFARKHFDFEKALISHIAANREGIRYVQSTLDDFEVEGFMNYAHLSTSLDKMSGYMQDGLELIPDFGDKVFGTLGSDYSIFDIQEKLKQLVGTGVGKVELLKGTILHLLQVSERDEYKTDRRISWMTPSWLSAALRWYATMNEIPFRGITSDQIDEILLDLGRRDFVNVESRPYKTGVAKIYHLTSDGTAYATKVYNPVLSDLGMLSNVKKHFDFLIHLFPEEIAKNIQDEIWR